MEPDVKPSADAPPARPEDLVRRLGHAERDYARALAAALDLGVTDLIALGELFGPDPVGVTQLGRGLGLGSAAATGLADRLERAGHVTRQPHPDDRRRLVLTPTEGARAEVMRNLGPMADDVAAVVDALDPTARAAVVDFLQRVIDIYGRHATALRPA